MHIDSTITTLFSDVIIQKSYTTLTKEFKFAKGAHILKGVGRDPLSLNISQTNRANEARKILPASAYYIEMSRIAEALGLYTSVRGSGWAYVGKGDYFEGLLNGI